MNTHDIIKKKHLLEPLIDNAILNSVEWVSQYCAPQEPDYIASLSINFTKDLFHILTAVFPYYEFSITGVYCHQKPIVDIKMKKKPELGDLLFVFVDKSQPEKRLNSLLLQAKITSSPVLKIPSSDKHQLELYRNWPEFTYLRAGLLNGRKRDILPKTINDGAQYLLIDNNPHTNGLYGRTGTYPMGCAIPGEELRINNSLATELIDFLKFKSGRAFEDEYYDCKDDWSNMIWDLLHITSLKFSRRKNAKLDKFPRLNECVNFSSDGMYGRSLLDEIQTDEVSHYKNQNYDFDEEAGVSVIIIESSARQELQY
jgi:hypothetical protein